MFMPTAYHLRPTSAEARLEQLIVERLKPGADQELIDQRIWSLFGERWCIMFTDLSGFSRQVAEFGIIHFLQIIYESQRLLTPCVEAHDGVLLKAEADSLMIIFRQPGSALDAALQMMKVLHQHNQTRAPSEQVLLCLGLGWGQVLRVGDFEVFGPEVNAASKLGEDTAKAGEILVTGSVEEALRHRRDVRFERLADSPPGAATAFKAIYTL